MRDFIENERKKRFFPRFSRDLSIARLPANHSSGRMEFEMESESQLEDGSPSNLATCSVLLPSALLSGSAASPTASQMLPQLCSQFAVCTGDEQEAS